MRIKMPAEEALYCPKHGRQVYYISSVGKNPVRWCSELVKSRGSGLVVAFVTNKGKIIDALYMSNKQSKEVDRTNAKPVFYSECHQDLYSRMVRPKIEKLKGIVWKYEWNSGIWRGVLNGELAVSSGKGKHKWQYYAPQFNNEESRKAKKGCWLGSFAWRTDAMEAAITNWNSIKAGACG